MQITINSKGNCLIATSDTRIDHDTKLPQKYYVTPHVNPFRELVLKTMDFSIEEAKNLYAGGNTSDVILHVLERARAVIKDLKGILWTCTCRSYTMDIKRYGGNPFANPCKHVSYALKNKVRLVQKVEKSLNANQNP